MAAVNFTKLQADEAAHKLGIVACEPDLQESYEITEDQAEDAVALFSIRRAGVYIIPDAIAACLIGEFENSIDIALSNMSAEDDKGKADLASFISSMRSAQRKLRIATERLT